MKAGIWFFAAYIGCVFGANWAAQQYGIVNIGFGLSAPAGLYFVGLAFTMRDFTQETMGRYWTLAAVTVGALASYLVAPNFAFASFAAFLLSESLDFAVYTPLRHRNWGAAVLFSNLAGSVADSVLFLWLAFGWASVSQFWFGQTVGKMYMALPFVALIWLYRAWRHRDLSLGVRAA